MPRRDTRLSFVEALEVAADAGAPWVAIARDPRRGYCSAKKRLTRRELVPALQLAESPPDPDDTIGQAADREAARRWKILRAPKRPGKYTLFGWLSEASEARPVVRARFRVRRRGR